MSDSRFDPNQQPPILPRNNRTDPQQHANTLEETRRKLAEAERQANIDPRIGSEIDPVTGMPINSANMPQIPELPPPPAPIYGGPPRFNDQNSMNNQPPGPMMMPAYGGPPWRRLVGASQPRSLRDLALPVSMAIGIGVAISIFFASGSIFLALLGAPSVFVVCMLLAVILLPR